MAPRAIPPVPRSWNGPVAPQASQLIHGDLTGNLRYIPAYIVTRVDSQFSGELWEWRGPAPFYWVTVPEDSCAYVRAEATEATYGWGAIPVRARIGATEWETSLLPKNGGYVLPVKTAVRNREGVADGDLVTVALSVTPRGGRRANGTGATT